MSPPRPALLLLLTVLTALLGPACVPAAEEGARACPCSEGWTCCPGVDLCVAGGLSHCPAVPVPDTVAPDAPRLDGTRPASPARTASVALEGRSEPRARVQVHAGPGCADAPAAEAQADTSGAFAVPVALAPNAQSTFSARAVDAAGNASACSDALAVLHDDRPPPTPELIGLAPASPSATTTRPALLARAEPGARVRLFSDALCVQALPFVATADAAGVAQVWARVEPDSRATFYARAEDAAGNASGCTPAGLEFAHDATPPAPPVLAGTTPASPSFEPEATWSGTAEPGARVRVHATADCTDTPLDAATADAAGAWDVRLAAAPNTATQRYATSTDAAGNASACVALGTYVHDDVPPTFAQLERFSPASPNNLSATPTLTVRAEADATVVVHGTLPGHFTDRELARVRTDASGTARAELALAEGITELRLSVVDAAGNPSGALPWGYTGSYEYDVTPPVRPTARFFSEPVPNTSVAEVHLLGDAEMRARVEVYGEAGCAGPLLVDAWASPSFVPHLPATPGYSARVTVNPDADITYSVRARDPAGNHSECSEGLTLPRRPAAGRMWSGINSWSGAPALLEGAEHYVELGFGNTDRFDDNSPLRVRRGAFAGGAWTEDRKLADYANLVRRTPGLWRNARGDLLVAWAEGSTYTDAWVRLARYDAAAGLWSAASAPADAPAEADVSLGADGRTLTCWTLQPAVPAAPQRRCSRAELDGAWTPPETLHTEAASSELATGAGGALSVRLSAAGALVARTLAAGAGWGEDAELATGVRHWDVQTGDDGAAWLAYLVMGAGEAADGVWVRTLPAGGAQWSAAERVLAAPAEALATQARVRVGAGGPGDVAVGLATAGRLESRVRTAVDGWGDGAVLALQDEAGLPEGRFVLGAPGEAWFRWRTLMGGAGSSTFRKGGWGYSQHAAVRVARTTRTGGWEGAQTLIVALGRYDPDTLELTTASATRQPDGPFLVSFRYYSDYSQAESAGYRQLLR